MLGENSQTCAIGRCSFLYSCWEWIATSTPTTRSILRSTERGTAAATTRRISRILPTSFRSRNFSLSRLPPSLSPVHLLFRSTQNASEYRQTPDSNPYANPYSHSLAPPGQNGLPGVGGGQSAAAQAAAEAAYYNNGMHLGGPHHAGMGFLPTRQPVSKEFLLHFRFSKRN